jgi:hypothetical protein
MQEGSGTRDLVGVFHLIDDYVWSTMSMSITCGSSAIGMLMGLGMNGMGMSGAMNPMGRGFTMGPQGMPRGGVLEGPMGSMAMPSFNMGLGKFMGQMGPNMAMPQVKPSNPGMFYSKLLQPPH